MLPNARLLAKAFHRTAVTIKPTAPATASLTRSISSTATRYGDAKGIGSTKEDHTTETSDSHNVQYDGTKAGKEAKERGDSDPATSGKDPRNATKKEEAKHPKSPKPIIGMQDQVGDVGSS
jgi:hypothetical protein